MRPPSEVLGVMYPVGGGDPIPLTKVEIVIGRRPGNDIRLDFENVSGKHCKLRFANGLWMARDLGSTNGTTVNGSVLASEWKQDERARLLYLDIGLLAGALLAALSALALILGAVGIYGVMAHFATRRKRDWAIKVWQSLRHDDRTA